MKTKIRSRQIFLSIATSLLGCIQIYGQTSAQTNSLPNPITLHRHAVEDSNRNWGPAVDGLKLSVSVSRHAFVQHEPVEAVVVLRNLNLEPGYIRRVIYPFEFTLSLGTNRFSLRRPKIEPPPVDPDKLNYPALLPIGTEEVAVVRLDQMFDLAQPGEYSIEAVFPRYTEDRPMTNILSGAATFRILKSDEAEQ